MKGTRKMTADNQDPGYCPAHAALVRQYDRDFGPFPGCRDCRQAPGFDPKTQYHLRDDPEPSQ